MPLTVETIEKIAAELKSLPPIENKQREVSKQEAVRLLAKEIGALQQRGYTLEQVATRLQSKGLDVNTATLKNYLRRAKPVKKTDTPRRPRQAVVPPPETAGSEPALGEITDPATPA